MDFLDKSFKAVTKALHVFSTKYDNVCIPIRPTYQFDLIAIKGTQILRVKVLTTKTKAPSGTYIANLRKSGGYHKQNTQKAPFDNKSCDFVFIETPLNYYLIPSSEIVQERQLSLSQYEKFVIPS